MTNGFLFMNRYVAVRNTCVEVLENGVINKGYTRGTGNSYKRPYDHVNACLPAVNA